MSRCYPHPIAIAAVVFLAAWQTALAQTSTTSPYNSQPSTPAVPSKPAEATSVVYRLSDLTDDPSFGKWVADTIPEMVLPGTWGHMGGIGKISYHPPTRVLVIHHTSAAHAKVEAFLRDVKKSMPAEGVRSAATKHGMTGGVMHAMHTSPVRAADPMAVGSSYLIPPPQGQPKHLFHLILRYEGDGASDASPTGALRDLFGTLGLTATDGPAKDNEKPAPPAAKNGQSLGDLFHIIVRYEGDGIIDANVVNLIKELQKGGDGPGCGGFIQRSPVPYLNGQPPCTSCPPACPVCPVPNPTSGSVLVPAPFATSPVPTSGQPLPATPPPPPPTDSGTPNALSSPVPAPGASTQVPDSRPATPPTPTDQPRR